MSRIGKNPINIPEGVTVQAADNSLLVKGPKGELKQSLPSGFMLEVREGQVLIIPKEVNKRSPALWGLLRSLAANMVEGVTRGFEKKLEFEGIGYRAAVEGDLLILQLGFSHPVRFAIPPGIKILVEKNVIKVSGIDKWLVGETAARVRALKRPEPYKGKGIRYQGEVIRRKAGKKAVAAA